MLNIVIPITNNLDKYRKLLDATAGSYDIKVLIGIKHELYSSAVNEYDNADNFNFFEFDNSANKEAMINYMQEYLEEGSILVLRKPISVNEFEKITKSDRDIVTSKKNRSRVKTFIFGLWQKITKMILGVKMYAGDYSMIYFNKDIANVIMRTGNLSYASRVNRWKGVKQGVISTEANADRIERDPSLQLKFIIPSVALLVVGAFVTTVVSLFVKMTIIIGLFLFCLDAICLVVACILTTMLIFTNMTGKKQYGKALVMNKKVNNEEDL